MPTRLVADGALDGGLVEALDAVGDEAGRMADLCGGAAWMGPAYPYGAMVPYNPDPQLEAAALKETAEALESDLKEIKQRLAELEDNE